MTGFGALPIGRKLAVIGLATVGLALFLNSLIALISTFVIMRRSIVADVFAQSALIADNTSAAVAFDDSATANQTLDLLRDKASVDLACLFDAEAVLFARYQDAQHEAGCPVVPPADGTIVTLTGMLSIAPVSVEGRRVGTLYLHGNYSQVWQQLRGQAVAAVVGLILSAAGALLLMHRLHRTLVDPLSHLSSVATRVSAKHDYSIRATKFTEDEIGTLVDAFNEMLSQVQRRESDLSKVNVDLSREIVERQRVENDRTVLLQRERDANRVKDEFLAALSHELRTPLNAILGWAQLLEQTGLDGKTSAQGLASIHRNARAQARLIDDLLDISRIVSGKFHLKTQAVEASSIVASAVEVLKTAAAAKAVEVKAVIGTSTRPVSADPERLQQVLWNLLSNAIKFTPAGGRVEVRVETLGGECTIEVSDTGVGIAPEFLPYVFDRFRQADGSLTREHGGLGLGLAIVREIVEMHGGTVSASSPGRDRGATFTVRLPLAQGPVTGEAAAAAAPSARPLAGARVLVIDDDRDARDIAATALGAAGAEVVAVGSPDEALEQTSNGSLFSVLICDIGMRGMNGYEVLRRIRLQEAPRGRKTPAIAMTAHASIEDIARAKAAGFGWHVAKPVAVATLVHTVTTAATIPSTSE
jgi:signal transduction histidine kinase/ActR/RegA family two-component response regulator